ncbi:MAG TPA: class I SAM-dependent methyltransferase [Vicinamibacterales bacterium]|nr:class I SAM-dependent methyltransferase [Vicinamibacterales bacterium]
MDAKQHWEHVYSTKSATEVSWFQREARVSLDLITRAAGPAAAILDAGGGTSTLVDGLLDRGYTGVTVLDIAAAALEAAQARLGSRAARVRWLAADLLRHPFARHGLDVWHDRAVFHFLTSAADRQAYVAQVARAVRPGGHVIVATFAADGPTKCSGLDVCRYSPGALHAEFGAAFELLGKVFEEHVTPAGHLQRFQYCLCAVRASASVAA